jgi:very-short-patch-repair endonuclease
MAADNPYDIARQQGGLIRRDQLREAGLDWRALGRRVERGDLIPVTSGLFRLSGAPNNWHQRIWEALLAAQDDAVVSHRTAARLHGVGSFSNAEIDIVQHGNPVAWPVDPSLHRSLQLPEHHRTLIEGIPTTTLERTIFDLAGLVSRKRWQRGWPSLPRFTVERILDDALVRGLPIGRVQGVLDEIGGRGRGGTAVLRELLEPRGEGYVATESMLEDEVFRIVRNARLPVPVRQRIIGGMDEPIGRVDLLMVRFQVVIEADGRKHHIALIDHERDRWRDLELAAAGFQVVRVTWHQIKRESNRLVTQLERILRLRGWEPDPVDRPLAG